MEIPQQLEGWESVAWFAGLLAAAALAGWLVQAVAFAILGRIARRTGAVLDDSLVRHGRRPARAIAILLAMFLVLPLLPGSVVVLDVVRHALVLALTAAVGWLVISLTAVIEDLVSARYRVDVRDNALARQVHTQTRMLRRVAVAVVLVVTVCLMLMTFPSIRQIGVSLFASAGVAGLVIGFAARPALSNLIAGVQLALTSPIRIDDVVIVEGEFGWIEEIRTTYVVVRVWDLRRLIVPLSYFIEQPFQNWTRRTANLLGTVFLYADYTVPVAEIRAALHKVLEDSGQWDGKVWGLQVTGANERTIEMRALMSAPDAGSAWNLRCHVREAMIEMMQQRFPDSLPRVRAELDRLPPAGSEQAAAE